jgi:glycosyltransferase involved in cell wall biosynthesis
LGMRVLFLYSELADYFVKCCTRLAGEAEVHIVRWPVNPEAPFHFSFPENIRVYDQNEYRGKALRRLAVSIDPDVIVCSGWRSFGYLRSAALFRNKIAIVLALDTQWRGDLRQKAGSLLIRLLIRPLFSHCWVPGRSQARLARKIGFGESRIRTGFYCCDLDRFNRIYSAQRAAKQQSYPKRFIYSARYYSFKGIADLWDAFISLQRENENEWELWCMGTGDLVPVVHPGIRHFGFVQPENLEPILKECGIYILPSHYEPWAVSVHEFAAAGFPLILSSEVGASQAFPIEGENGWSFPAGNVVALKAAMKKMIHLNDKELLKMGGKSHDLAQGINPEQWTSTLLEIANGYGKN